MNENNNVAPNENVPEENSNLNWPTFDYNEQNWPANRLYVSELPENPIPGIQRQRDDSQELILKFDWYFSTTENELQSREFSVPKSGKKFSLKARCSTWMECGKHVQVLLLTGDDCPKTVSVEYTAKLRSPNWKCVEELRGCQEFNFACKGIDLFSIQGKPVDVWPAEATTELIAEMDLIPKVYAVKGTLKCLKDRVQNWKLVSRPRAKDSDLLKLDV